MGMPVQTVASGGLPVVDVTATTPKLGLPVTETTRGIPVTKVIAPKPGLAVVYGTFVDWPPAGGAFTATAFDPASLTNTSLSGSNLVVTHTTNGTLGGARSLAVKSSGKYYFEVLVGVGHGGSGNDCLGILLSTGTYTNFINADAAFTVSLVLASGAVWSNFTTTKNVGVLVPGDRAGAGIDLDNRKAWFRKNGGNWNGLAIGSENPATNTGGVTIPAGSFGPAFGMNWTLNDVMTANFGGSAFTDAVPAGFTSGWPT